VLSSLLALQLELMKPIGIGILGPEILPDQIQSRLRPYARDAVTALAGMLGGDEPTG
jgi:6,7-dimethyl-8-ribityllumazine synthase